MKRAAPFLAAGLVLAAVAAASLTVAAQAPAVPEEIARRQFESGLEFLRSGRSAEALKDFETVVESYAATTVADDAQLAIARYQLEVQRDPTAAQATAESLLKKFPASDSVPMAYVVAGQAMMALGATPANVDAALASFERVPRLFPGTDAVAPAVFQAGDTLRRLNRCPEALERFTRVVLEFPRTPWASLAQLGTGACQVAAGEWRDALLSLQRVGEASPGTPQAETARTWNTILYRLHVRPPAQPAYTLAARTIGGPTGKLKDVNALAMGADGLLYVAHGNGVLVLDPKGTASRGIGTLEARSVFVDPRGRLLVAQKALLQQEGMQPPLVTASVPREGGPARILDDLSAVVSLSSGVRLLADRELRAVYRFSDDGKYVGPFASIRAARMAVNDADDVALLDRDARAITILDRDGQVKARIATRGQGYDLSDAADLAFDALGHLYVLGRSEITVFAPNGRVLTVVTPPAGDRTPGLRAGRALALDQAARLYVYDDRAERILVFQ